MKVKYFLDLEILSLESIIAIKVVIGSTNPVK